VALGDGAKKALDFARPLMALYVGGMGAKGKNFYNQLVTRYGWGAEAEQIQDLYLDGKKDEAAALLPDELLDLTNLCGDEGWVKDRIAAYKEAGVTNLLVTPIGDPREIIPKIKEWAA
jgi:alkanesulfonate monooxygenase SsuD/methylene tetrahydromethanopterin reductase-like flavin-dependent oxidoreductase (luciferase family)